jgi:predicted DsbA family dithiol-disulfide isomerase
MFGDLPPQLLYYVAIRQQKENYAMSVVIQVFSDYVCPYCLLGEVALQRAVAATGAEAVHRAYQLRESGPPKLDPRGDEMNRSWKNSIYPMAKELGIEIRQPSRSPLTRSAHEAAAWARRQGRFDQFHRQLFNAFFVEDRDLSEISVLKELAWQAGLNPKELENVLAERRMAEEVEEDLMIARAYNITIVPSFVIAGHILGGIQNEAVLIKAIELASAGKLEAETKKLPHLPVNIVRR